MHRRIYLQLLLILSISCDSTEDSENNISLPVCNPSEKRCNAEEIESCNLQGQWETSKCPVGYACFLVNNEPSCDHQNQGGLIPTIDMMIGGNQGGSMPMADMMIGGNQGGSTLMADMMLVEDGVCEASFVLKVGNHPELILDGCQSWGVDLNYEYDPDVPPQINGGTIQFKATAGNFDCDLTFEFTSLSCGLSQVYQVGSTLNIRGCSGLADQYEGVYHVNADQGLIISFSEINTGNQNGNFSGIPFLTRLSGHVGTVPENGISLSNSQGSFQSYLYGSFLISSVQVRDDLVQNANCNRNPSVPIYDFDGDGEGFFIYGYGDHDCNDRNPSISSSAIEICDSIDNDCDGQINENILNCCGNGIREELETCDDGNQVNTDACTSSCMTAKCGDGLIHVGAEICDDDNEINRDACTNTCVLVRCGDGFVRAGIEACDDGNLINTDSCTNICQVARCGDGFIQAGEACDDGNSIDIDTCRNNCQFNGPPCGINCPFIEMILIEAGSFNMGGNNINNPQTRPIHNVQIRSNFYVGKTEVTVGQYRACVNAGQCSEPNSSGITLALLCNWTMMPGSKETHLVNCITWGQARTF